MATENRFNGFGLHQSWSILDREKQLTNDLVSDKVYKLVEQE